MYRNRKLVLIANEDVTILLDATFSSTDGSSVLRETQAVASAT